MDKTLELLITCQPNLICKNTWKTPQKNGIFLTQVSLAIWRDLGRLMLLIDL
jgi:hypothetical protein